MDDNEARIRELLLRARSGAGNQLLSLSSPGDSAEKYSVIEPSSAVSSPGVALPIE